MKKEQKCISLSLAKEIQRVAKEKGFKLPESENMYADNVKLIFDFSTKNSKKKKWMTIIEKDIFQTSCDDLDKEWLKEHPHYPAYDTSELGEILPIIFETDSKLKQYLDCYQMESKEWECSYGEALGGIYFTEKTEAEARGKLLLYLINNNLL